MALDTVRKISFKPTSRRSSHARTGQDRLAGTGRGKTALSRASAQVTRVFGTYRVEVQAAPRGADQFRAVAVGQAAGHE
jgi:hypothetical protein